LFNGVVIDHRKHGQELKVCYGVAHASCNDARKLACVCARRIIIIIMALSKPTVIEDVRTLMPLPDFLAIWRNYVGLAITNHYSIVQNIYMLAGYAMVPCPDCFAAVSTPHLCGAPPSYSTATAPAQAHVQAPAQHPLCARCYRQSLGDVATLPEPHLPPNPSLVNHVRWIVAQALTGFWKDSMGSAIDADRRLHHATDSDEARARMHGLVDNMCRALMRIATIYVTKEDTKAKHIIPCGDRAWMPHMPDEIAANPRFPCGGVYDGHDCRLCSYCINYLRRAMGACPGCTRWMYVDPDTGEFYCRESIPRAATCFREWRRIRTCAWSEAMLGQANEAFARHLRVVRMTPAQYANTCYAAREFIRVGEAFAVPETQRDYVVLRVVSDVAGVLEDRGRLRTYDVGLDMIHSQIPAGSSDWGQ
jgi:hypothetical protein